MPSSCALLALALLASIAPSALFAQEDAVGNRVLEEVLVTAQKREQRITDVPMSITVLSGEFMSDAGIEDSAQLAAYIPGMTFSDTATGTPVYDGIKSKETYGTSGTFIRLRFFGSWNYPADLVKDKEFVKQGYEYGVPMGQDLPMKSGKAPTFAVWAMKDPESGNLDRIQIIKGWYKNGQPYEKIYDVAWSDNRKPDTITGKLPAAGNKVDIKNASYTNTIGDTQLSAVWTDPDFDPSQHAVYYARVIEIPKPRWTTCDAKALGIEPLKDVPATLQERAWSSPIWYTPEGKLAKKQDFYPGLQAYLP